MSRYFYYKVFMIMLLNTFIYVPRILLMNRFDGALSSILLAVPIGSAFMYALLFSLRRYPEMGLPEILECHLPAYVRAPILVWFGFMWYSAGAIALVAYVMTVKRFMNPAMTGMGLIVLMSAAAVWAAVQNTKTVLYCMEAVILLVFPVSVFILSKALGDDNFNWQAVKIFTDEIWEWPKLSTLASALYVYTGYIGMAIFNRVISAQKLIRRVWPIPFLGLAVLSTTFFIPIGMLGTEAVGQYNYPWVSTADTFQMKLGPVERLLYVYLIMYLFVTLLTASVVWHEATEMLKGIFRKLPPNTEANRTPRTTLALCGLFAAGTLAYEFFFNENQAYRHAQVWLVLRFFSEVLLVSLLLILSRLRRKRV